MNASYVFFNLIRTVRSQKSSPHSWTRRTIRDALYVTFNHASLIVSHRPIYLDYNATTPVDARVAAVVVRYMVDDFGNSASADHTFGDEADAAVVEAQSNVAGLVGAPHSRVIFTSGATEAANLALRGICAAAATVRHAKVRIAVSAVEHPAVLETCSDLQRAHLAEMVVVRVDSEGRLNMEDLERRCIEGLDVVCVMAVNNEVGNLYPLREIAQMARANGALFFSDATQAAGKLPLHFEQWGVDLLALSAHKFYGPKGVGALVVREGLRLAPIITGGAQQRGVRGGTLNVPGIAGLGEAARLRTSEMDVDESRIRRMRDHLEDALLRELGDAVVNGDRRNRVAGTLHLSVPGVPNRAVVSRLRDRLALSTGSACASGVEMPSHVLRAMGLPDSHLSGALRISLGKFTTDDELALATSLLGDVVSSIRRRLPG